MSLAKRAIEEFGACQKEQELQWLIDYLEPIKLERVLEIGVQDAGTLWLWSQLATPTARIVGIDLDDPHQGHRRDQQWVTLVCADSHDRGMPARVGNFFDGQPLDLLFIDGDHTYDGVKQDFETYSPLVRTGGVIALHDVVKHESPEASDVERFWLELLPGHPEALAFVDDRWQDTRRGKLPPMSCGIGVIRQH